MMHIKDDSAGIRRRLLQEFQTKSELQFAMDRLKRFLNEMQEVKKTNLPDW